MSKTKRPRTSERVTAYAFRVCINALLGVAFDCIDYVGKVNVPERRARAKRVIARNTRYALDGELEKMGFFEDDRYELRYKIDP